MKPALLLCGALAFAALSGCGDVCDKFQTVHNDCGGNTLNKASCENAIKNCTATDQSILSDLADCLTRPSNCANGAVVSLSLPCTIVLLDPGHAS